MKIWSKENLSGAGALVAATMIANFLNFVFNAYLGRSLTYEQFGILTFLTTILYLSSIFFGALGTAVNHRTAYLNGKYDKEAGSAFSKFVRNRSYLYGALIMVIWLALIPLTGKLFQIEQVWSLVAFSPIFVAGLILVVNKGFLQGNLHFISISILVIAEVAVKLAAAILLVLSGFQDYVYLSIPFGLIVTFLLSLYLAKRNTRINQAGTNNFRFPKRFMAAAAITGLSSAVFLSVDLLLAKHYLSPVEAGQYSMLSLVGKMVFFLGSILNSLMITFISHDLGTNQNTLKTFYRLMGVTIALTTAGVIAFGYLGHLTVPLLLGDRALPILEFLGTYCLAIGMFTIATVIVVYHMALEEYTFSIAAIGVAILMSLGIIIKHENIAAFTQIILLSSIVSLVVMTSLHLLQRNRRFILANIIDLLNLFSPLEKQERLSVYGKRILIFNWRDTKHKMAGGAEIYIHELAKRWVAAGHQVTLFCGNDGDSLRNETIDGVRIVRRGGFYFVYLWAFIYYLMRFRGKFDLIIDGHNGIPFFTPVYAKEKVYALLHHVHQDVFYKFLPKPLAMLAAVLENRAMPYVYRNTKFITISESSKKDMLTWDLTGSGIDIVSPGVDLSSLKPAEKSEVPTILYLGRLKEYKSVDVLIKAFKKVTEKITDAVLIIAGTGEDEIRLRTLAVTLGLNNKVKFMGKVDDDQKVELLQKAWVFVNPSMMEGWGITTIEAGACATPVVASDVPGLRDSVNNPHTGFLVPYGNVSAFAEKITMLLKDENLREEMSEQGVVWAKNFGWDKSSKYFLSLIVAKKLTPDR